MFVDGAGELMFLPGRMSAQVPFNMLITGAMVTFYKGAAIYKHYASTPDPDPQHCIMGTGTSFCSVKTSVILSLDED